MATRAASRPVRRRRLRKQFHQSQGYWSRKAKEKGILSERDLERYLNQ